MDYRLKLNLLRYFGGKKHPTEPERMFFAVLKNEASRFDISSVCRDDFTDTEYDGDRLTDEQMHRLAQRMDRAYQENGYMEDLREIAHMLNFPTKQNTKKH